MAEDELTPAGVGRTLMTAFARQLRGRAEVEPKGGRMGGYVSRLTFPLPEPPPASEPDVLRHPFGNQAAA